MPTLGIIMPEMGMMMDALFPETRQRVLGLLFGQPDRRFFANELIALTGSGSGAVQRELQRLVESGLVTVTRSGSRAYHQANPQAPLFPELHSLMVKTVGLAEPVKSALRRLGPQIRFATLYGSVAKGTDSAQSDIDLLVVSNDLTLEALYAKIAAAERKLARKINVTLYTEDEYNMRRKDRTSFLSRVLAATHIPLIGSGDGTATA
ncbi:MAG: nucleotidyltransferase domain-containing protein [Bryobacteraceae bacterium]